MAGMGLLPGEIARVIGCSVSTLRKYHGEDLRTAAPKANAAVALSVFKQATHEQKPNVVAGIFWLKCRGGWIEADKQEALNKAGGKKENRQAAAEKVARSGRFKPSEPPRLAAVNGQVVKPPEGSEPSS